MHRRVLFLVVVVVLAAACGSAAPMAQAYAPATAGVSQPVLAAASDRRMRTASPDSAEAASESSGGAIDQKLMKNATLTVRVPDDDDFGPSVLRVETVAQTLEGYVTHQTRESIAFKVPAGRLDEALAAISEVGKVIHRNVTTVDVTAQYTDLDIRIDNLQKMRVRLQELVVQGQNVKEILEVEKELSRVTAELEALEGQMRLMNNQVTFATVQVRFEERVTPGPIGWIFYGGYKAVKWLFVWD